MTNQLKLLRIFKAQDIGPSARTESLTIIMDEHVPDLSTATYRHRLEALYQADADKLADALNNALPGGTWDRLLVAMLKQKVCLLVIPHGRPEEVS